MSPFIVHHRLVTASPEEVPSQLMLVLHGAFGRGDNWRRFFRSLARERANWGFVLVDLRGHGESAGAPGPHDIAAAAADLGMLEATLPAPVVGVAGHSLGGKVALEYARLRAGLLRQVWVLDSNPGRDGRLEDSAAGRVLALLEASPEWYPSRQAFVDMIIAKGFSKLLAGWLAMSLRSVDGGYRLGLELATIGDMLRDFFECDYWSEVARDDALRALHLVVAAESPVYDATARERLARQAAELPAIFAHEVPKAGHWLHVDAPDALATLFLQHLR